MYGIEVDGWLLFLKEAHHAQILRFFLKMLASGRPQSTSRHLRPAGFVQMITVVFDIFWLSVETPEGKT